MTKPHNPWEGFLNNCATGDNHFRSSEYQELIDFIDGIQAENAAMKEQVAQLQAIISEEAKDSGNVILELTALQSKSAALVDALETVANWLVCAPIASAEDMAQSFFPIFKLCEEALASFKGSK